MAAFSRGFSTLHQHSLHLPSSIRTAIFAARPQFAARNTHSRFFTSSTLRRLPSPARYPGSSPAGSPLQSDPVLRSVIQTREPVLLYKEPPTRPFLFRVYGFALAATGIGAFNFWWAAHLPKEQPWFVPPTYLFIGVAFTAIGIHIFQRPVRRISLLEIIPGSMGGRLQLRITGRKQPFARESIVTTDIWDATISEKTHPMVEEMTEANRARRQRLRDGLEHMGIVPKIWELAARWLDQKFTSFFLNFKFAVLQFGIAQIEVDGVKWKLDCTGYLREEGKAIDRVISEE